jgi:hypothetical protein
MEYSIMAICSVCQLEMNEAEGCILQKIPTVDGELEPLKFGEELDLGIKALAFKNGSPRRCGDCGCMPGNYHHPGCDIEECPRCHGQLFSCDCLVEEDQ